MLIVNIFGAPGAGKSTYAARLYSELKMAGVETELVREVAKQYVYDGTLGHKPQMQILDEAVEQIESLHSNVEVVVSDSPILLSVVYAKDGVGDITERAKRYHYSRPSLNFFMNLGGEDDYNTRGRVHSYVEALKIENKIIGTVRDGIIGTFYGCWWLEDALKRVTLTASSIQKVINWEHLYSRASQ